MTKDYEKDGLPIAPMGGIGLDPLAAPRIVVIDDDRMILLMVARTLAARGMTCHTAATGAAGLALIREQAPDLVLLDIVLVGEDGFGICREIRRTWSAEDLPVVMVTSREDLDSINAAYLAGANDFITKPVNWEHLPFRIQHVLRASRAFKAIQDRTRTLRSLFAVIPDPIFMVDARDRVTLAHPGLGGEDDAARSSLGTLDQLLPPDLAGQVREHYREALAAPRQTLVMEAVHPYQDVQRSWEGRFIASGADRVLVMVRDITERKASEQRIKYMAYHDPLTGLLNRRALSMTLERIYQGLQRSEGALDQRTAALLYLDLDRFKRINDTLGHAIGDEVLKEVAVRIADVLRPSDLLARAESSDLGSVARIGGDEFCLILKRLASPVEAARVAQRILDRLRQPIHFEGHALEVTPSIGIALIPQDGADPETLLEHADRAMYAAKEGGRNGFQFFDLSLGSRLQERLALEAGLRRGLAGGEFHVQFQPQVDLRSSRIVGMEALLRWEDPERGVIPPDQFIRVAEETGLILDLGEMVFRQSLRFLQRLLAEGLPPIQVAVNLSGAQVLDPRMLGRIEAALALTGADPRRLEVEITETMLLEGSGRALESLQRLKGLGITLALDDFGTGFSSLSYLHTFPFDILKIDRSFIQSLAGGSQVNNLATAIIAMGKGLGLEVIAEGVEHREQASFLLACGCHKAQGYLFGAPMGPEAFLAFYREQVGGELREGLTRR